MNDSTELREFDLFGPLLPNVVIEIVNTKDNPVSIPLGYFVNTNVRFFGFEGSSISVDYKYMTPNSSVLWQFINLSIKIETKNLVSFVLMPFPNLFLRNSVFIVPKSRVTLEISCRFIDSDYQSVFNIDFITCYRFIVEVNEAPSVFKTKLVTVRIQNEDQFSKIIVNQINGVSIMLFNDYSISYIYGELEIVFQSIIHCVINLNTTFNTLSYVSLNHSYWVDYQGKIQFSIHGDIVVQKYKQNDIEHSRSIMTLYPGSKCTFNDTYFGGSIRINGNTSLFINTTSFTAVSISSRKDCPLLIKGRCEQIHLRYYHFGDRFESENKVTIYSDTGSLNQLRSDTVFSENISLKTSNITLLASSFPTNNLDLGLVQTFNWISDLTITNGIRVLKPVPDITNSLKVVLRIINSKTIEKYENMKNIVGKPFHCFCAPNLECEKMNFEFSGQSNIPGFNSNSSILVPDCNKVEIDNIITKCFGVRVVDFPFKLDPILIYLNEYTDEPYHVSSIFVNSTTLNDFEFYTSFVTRTMLIQIGEDMDSNTSFCFDSINSSVSLSIRAYDKKSQPKTYIKISSLTKRVIKKLLINELSPVFVATNQWNVIDIPTIQIGPSIELPSSIKNDFIFSNVENFYLHFYNLHLVKMGRIDSLYILTSLVKKFYIEYMSSMWRVFQKSYEKTLIDPHGDIRYIEFVHETALIINITRIDNSKIIPIIMKSINTSTSSLSLMIQITSSWNNCNSQSALILFDIGVVHISVFANCIPVDFSACGIVNILISSKSPDSPIIKVVPIAPISPIIEIHSNDAVSTIVFEKITINGNKTIYFHPSMVESMNQYRIMKLIIHTFSVFLVNNVAIIGDIDIPSNSKLRVFSTDFSKSSIKMNIDVGINNSKLVLLPGAAKPIPPLSIVISYKCSNITLEYGNKYTHSIIFFDNYIVDTKWVDPIILNPPNISVQDLILIPTVHSEMGVLQIIFEVKKHGPSLDNATIFTLVVSITMMILLVTVLCIRCKNANDELLNSIDHNPLVFEEEDQTDSF